MSSGLCGARFLASGLVFVPTPTARVAFCRFRPLLHLRRSIGGSVVEFSPATREARVRFPANAAEPLLCLSSRRQCQGRWSTNKRVMASPSGNRTPVSRVTGGDTLHYTNEDVSVSRKDSPGPKPCVRCRKLPESAAIGTPWTDVLAPDSCHRR